jgi:hypothetical protein
MEKEKKIVIGYHELSEKTQLDLFDRVRDIIREEIGEEGLEKEAKELKMNVEDLLYEKVDGEMGEYTFEINV